MARATNATRLLRAVRRGDPTARERLVVAHLGLVRSVAWRYRDLGLPLEDLVQEGSIGLLDAVDSFDPARDVAFERYARFRIRRAILAALTGQARLIRLPKAIVERRHALDRVEAAFVAAEHGRRPTSIELAAATGLSPAAVLEARSASLSPLSLDEPFLPDGSPLESVVADPTAGDPELEALEHEQAEQLQAALAALPAVRRRVVSRRFGLGGAPQSAAALAAELELSPQRTQAIARDALHELRAALADAEPHPASVIPRTGVQRRR
jgi:RNA polymerase primary sigma factor